MGAASLARAASGARAWTAARARVQLAVLTVIVAKSTVAVADNPLNSSDRTTVAAQAACADGDQSEFNIVPLVGGTSDIGIGIGEFSDLARVSRGADPYLWNVESAAFVSFKGSSEGLRIPYQDVFFRITVPRFVRRGLQLEVRPSFTSESTLGYYGLGNASRPPPPGSSDSYNWYGRTHPAVDVQLRWGLADHVAALIGARYTQNWLTIERGSKLWQDIELGSPEVRSLIGPTAPGGVALFSYGIQWDSRDSQVTSHRGSFHEAQFRASPGGTTDFPYRYAQGSVVSRLFLPIWLDHVTLAMRAVGDVMFGRPPIYELARFDDTYALGGPNGVRGVPGQRYYGKAKAFGNVELRSEVVSFRALGKPLRFGFVAFFDGGRVWADTSPQPALDGTGAGLKYGAGGGLRLQSGETFVLRGDIAWSPDASPIGAYFAAGQIF